MNKRMCFIFMGNLYLCPYINRYIENIDFDFDVIYWNREGLDEEIGAINTYHLDLVLPLGTKKNKFKKVKDYLIFKSFASDILKNNDYDGVILLQTSAGILLKNILINKYCKKYILDIRDYTMENNILFSILEKKVIENSALTVISSEGYKSFLPLYNYVTVHNDRNIDRDIIQKVRGRNKNKDKIVIAYIGYNHYQEQHKKLMLLFKNDSRFELQFIGKEAERLVSFSKENKISNVKIIGQFPPEKILDYYQNVDIIHNLYGNNTPALDYALSNKLYFAAELGMPILVCSGTFMEKTSIKYGFGYTFEMDNPRAVDELYNYYKSIEWEEFLSGCDKFLHMVKKENAQFRGELSSFFNERGN